MRLAYFVLLVYATSVLAGYWDIEQVDAAGWGAAVDMRWHADGRLFLCYGDASGGIRLASKDSVWSYEELPQWRTRRSGAQAFDIDPRGSIGVSYLGTDYHVWCALKTDTGWADIQTPFSVVGGYSYSTPQVALDTSGKPLLGFGLNYEFLLARMRDTSWVSETLHTASHARDCFLSKALGSRVDGTVWGVFVHGWASGLCTAYGAEVYSYRTLDSGVSVVLVRDGEILMSTSGCIDQHGVIHTCYSILISPFEKGTYLDQTQIDSVEAIAIGVKYDSLDRPHVAHLTLAKTLMYRYREAGTWHIFDLQTTGVTALSLAIDKNSQPLIAYTTAEGVFLAHGVDIAGQSEERQGPTAIGQELTASVIRNVLSLPEASSLKLQAASLLDATGRKVIDLHSGANDVSGLAPGVYFVREAQAQAQVRAVRKVVVTR